VGRERNEVLSGALGGGARQPQLEGKFRPVTSFQLAKDLLAAAVCIRVFGGDAVTLMRRIAAAGVRAGIHEMRRGARPEGGEL
jgi:hypothetical protein